MITNVPVLGFRVVDHRAVSANQHFASFAVQLERFPSVPQALLGMHRIRAVQLLRVLLELRNRDLMWQQYIGRRQNEENAKDELTFTYCIVTQNVCI